MLASRLTLAALCAAMLPSAFADFKHMISASPEPPVTLQAIVTVGSTSACGMREAPHLIEHLLLSGTAYGESPVDAILALRAEGIKLSALTRSDFTQFTLEGPADKAKLMERAIVTFLGQPSLPKSGFEREKRVILHELRVPDSYVSSPSFYERFIAATAGAVEPCAADQSTFLGYSYDQVQSIYSRLYTTSTIKLVAQGPAQTFDLRSITASIMTGHVKAPPNLQFGKREPADDIEVFGRNGLVEIIFPIGGRAELPEDAAHAYADQARLELQAHVRREYQLYSARSFVDQSMHGGWIRLEVPDVDHSSAPELVEVATSAIAKVDAHNYRADPVWQALGSKRSANEVGAPVIARFDQKGLGWWARIKEVLGATGPEQ